MQKKKIKWCALQHIKWNYLQLVAHDDEKLKNRKKIIENIKTTAAT